MALTVNVSVPLISDDCCTQNVIRSATPSNAPPTATSTANSTPQIGGPPGSMRNRLSPTTMESANAVRPVNRRRANTIAGTHLRMAREPRGKSVQVVCRHDCTQLRGTREEDLTKGAFSGD